MAPYRWNLTPSLSDPVAPVLRGLHDLPGVPEPLTLHAVSNEINRGHRNPRGAHPLRGLAVSKGATGGSDIGLSGSAISSGHIPLLADDTPDDVDRTGNDQEQPDWQTRFVA